jgi:HK97 family phage prohead protease
MSARTAPIAGARLDRFVTIERDDTTPKVRRARFVASDETVDRYGDVIRANGWQLDAYRKNPVLLYGHNSRDLPIGRVEPIGVEGTKLVAHAEFAKEGSNPFADIVWSLLEQKMLNAVSVGFMPLAPPNPMFDEDKYLTGFEFIAQELLELSVVPVPANPNALQLAKSASLSDADLSRLFGRDVVRARVAAQRRSQQITLARLRRH